MKHLLALVALFVAMFLSASYAQEDAKPAAKSDKASKATKAATGPGRWEDTIKTFEAADAAMPPPKGVVLLVGGSNARRWTDVGEYFPQHQVINRGFGGAKLTEVLHFVDRIVIPYEPKTIVLNAGGNDLSAGKTPAQIRDAAREFITTVRAKLPETRIIYLGLPRVRRASDNSEILTTIREMNRLIAELANTEKNFYFIDVFSSFLDEQKQSRPELFVEDGTHYSPKGYSIVANLLRDKL